ncbi:oxygen-independent coproporphyrinogen-3 oxidase [Caloramator fervidus]|uniref:Oxygen-independent coproporphyrinogen-3 oxidase n=1 Tax=Caloramator fervidus TaxID=29344 RepID=A0A1H5W0U6_9CLOT|nr:coproporphyrinogen dehydrogenase HemZ [Caloramator fervidus]SEF92407.1 oxygen-independent coproporphyrinogen-3 oxidase [Caloramator fervidus]
MKIGLKGHDFRYEVFHIVSLYIPKEEIEFVEDNCDLEVVYDENNGSVLCRYKDFIKEYKLKSNDKKELKNAIKKVVLKLFENITGVSMLWGILVGIRPTKIVHDALSKGFSEDEIKNMLVEEYLVSSEKAELVLEVAKNESKYLKPPSKSVGLYIGIPFCPTRCSYCSFTSNPYYGNKQVSDYLLALKKEFYSIVNFLNENKVKIDTLYIGGGTPTSLNEYELEDFLSWINELICVNDLREFTVEAGRPDSLNRKKLNILKKNFVSRISINPQSMNQETLNLIGRKHSVDDVVEKFYVARECGFDNINMDIIIGLPNENEEHIKKTMKKIADLNPDSITIHTMAIKRASILNEKMFKGDKDTANKMYDIATKYVRYMGMRPYYMYRQKNMVSPLENIGYSYFGKECIYNIQMISESTTVVALGADAVTKIIYEDSGRIERVANLKDIKEYINRIDEQINKKLKKLIDSPLTY